MAINSWNLTTGGTWATAGNWSLGTIPAAGEDIVISQPFSADAVLVATAATALAYKSFSFADTTGGNNSITVAGTSASLPTNTFKWTLSAGSNPISVAATTTTPNASIALFIGITGVGKLVKSGAGAFAAAGDTSVYDFSGGFDLTEGSFTWYYNTTTKTKSFGSGLWTMSTGTSLSYGSGAVTFTQSNNIQLNGNNTISNDGVAGAVFVLSGALTGTAGFTKAGTGTLTLTGSIAGLTGTISHNQTTSAYFLFNNAAFNTLVSGTVINVTGPADYGATGNRILVFAPSTATSSTAAGVTFSGTGAVVLEPSATSTGTGHTFLAGALAGLTGTTAPSTTSFLAPSAGFAQSTSSNTSFPTIIVTANDLPSVYSFFFSQAGTTANTRTLYYSGAATTYGTRFDVASAGTGIATSFTANLYANQPSGTLTLTGGITRYEQTGQARTVTLTLRGTGDAVQSGAITQASGGSYGSGVLAITKADANKWVLSGANTYAGTTSISAGTLAGNSTAAFGTSAGTTSVITQTGGTLEFGAVVNKGTNAVTLLSLAGATAVSSPTGTTGLTCAGVVLSTAATIFDVAAGTFTLTNSATMSGVGFGISKIGAGEYVIASTVANNFTGAVSVSAGTLTIIGAAAPSSNGPLGNAATGVALTGTMKYAGTGAATISRSMTFTGSAPALEAAGTTSAAAVTFSAFTHAAGARTVTFKGDNAGDNTFSAVLNDNGASVVGLTKSGASKWILSAQPTYTGLTTVSAGELQFNETSLANNLTVNGTGKLSKTVLNGSSKTITCDGGTPEIVATTSANTVTGTTSVTAGTLRLTTDVSVSSKPAKVLGDTNTTVSASAAIRTSTGNTQRGQMRYGGNLTFSANSSLYIGG